MFNDWLPFAIYGLFALMIPATMMVGSFVFAQRPHRRVRARTIPFESGVSQGPPQRQRFTVSFYLTAMLFILFDIEIVFLYPLAVILHELAWFGFFEFLVFLRDPARRLRLHLAEGSARMALDKPLEDHGLKSERLLWPTKGPSKFEDEVNDLEQKVGLTTLAKAVAWAQTNSMWPDTFGLACCAIEMMSIVSALRHRAVRDGAVPRLAAPGRPDDRRRTRLPQDGAGAPHLRADAGAQVGDLDGRVRVLRRDVQQLRDRAGVDQIVPVDIYVPGCPPRPEQLIEGIVRLHEAVKAGVPPAYEIRSVAS